MCIVSMVIAEGQRLWPQEPTILPNIPITPYIPQYVPPVAFPNTQTPEQLEALKMWKEMLEKAKKLDTLTGQPDCEDPNKIEWATKLCNRLIEIGTELIKDTKKADLGVELIQLAKEIMDTIA